MRFPNVALRLNCVNVLVRDALSYMMFVFVSSCFCTSESVEMGFQAPPLTAPQQFVFF